MTPTENARCNAGAVSSKFSGFKSQHNRPTDETQFQPCADAGSPSPGDLFAEPRLERMIERVHSLGPRPLAELLAEIARSTGHANFIVNRLQAYAELDLEVVRAIGGDKFPPMALELIR